MELGDLISLLALGYACYKAGQWSVVIPIARGIQREIDAGRLTLEDEDDKDERRVRIERHNNQYFAYAVDGDFLAQGTTFSELFERFHSRFPQQSFRIQKNTDLSDQERSQMILALEELAKRMNTK